MTLPRNAWFETCIELHRKTICCDIFSNICGACRNHKEWKGSAWAASQSLCKYVHAYCYWLAICKRGAQHTLHLHLLVRWATFKEAWASSTRRYACNHLVLTRTQVDSASFIYFLVHGTAFAYSNHSWFARKYMLERRSVWHHAIEVITFALCVSSASVLLTKITSMVAKWSAAISKTEYVLVR